LVFFSESLMRSCCLDENPSPSVFWRVIFMFSNYN
jgi:hypothetical protein